MTRIGRLFERLKRDGRKGLIAYITAGDPAPDSSSWACRSPTRSPMAP
jgi:tryptophan synthase alpha subunit